MNVSPWLLFHATQVVRTLDEAIEEIRRAKVEGPVYLCGPIHGCSDEECQGWRSKAEAALPNCVNPILWDFRGKEAEHVSEIVLRDLAEVSRAGALLVNAGRPGWGTAMEVHEAWQQDKLIVAFTGDQTPGPRRTEIYCPSCGARNFKAEGALNPEAL
jgi:hypothetical protein